LGLDAHKEEVMGEMPRTFRKIGEVIEHIKSLRSLKEFAPEDFAARGGAADVVAKKEEEMRTVQLRRFFSEIDRLHKQYARQQDPLPPEFYSSMYLLHPLLAYAKGRKLISSGFFNLMMACLSPEKLRNSEDLTRLKEFMAAIVAYRKFYGERR